MTKSAWTSACASSCIDHSDLFSEADALFTGGPSEGCVYVELTTSGKSWGRGPVQSDVHGVMKRTTDSPAWRHIHMLASLTSQDGNTPLIKGFFENMEPPTKAEIEAMKAQAAKMDLVTMAKASGVARFMHDDPFQVLKDGRFETSFNLDGLWGGNMYAGGAGAILPNKITSKHNFRYVPRMNGLDIVKKLRAQLDANGYKDVEMKLIGDVPWSRGSSPDTDISHAHRKAGQVMESIGLGGGGGRAGQPALPTSAALTNPNLLYSETAADPAGGYWPSYLFADGEVGQKVGSVSIPDGHGRARRWRRRPRACRERVLHGRIGRQRRRPGERREERGGRALRIRADHDGAGEAEGEVADAPPRRTQRTQRTEA